MKWLPIFAAAIMCGAAACSSAPPQCPKFVSPGTSFLQSIAREWPTPFDAEKSLRRDFPAASFKYTAFGLEVFCAEGAISVLASSPEDPAYRIEVSAWAAAETPDATLAILLSSLLAAGQTSGVCQVRSLAGFPTRILSRVSRDSAEPVVNVLVQKCESLAPTPCRCSASGA